MKPGAWRSYSSLFWGICNLNCFYLAAQKTRWNSLTLENTDPVLTRTSRAIFWFVTIFWIVCHVYSQNCLNPFIDSACERPSWASLDLYRSVADALADMFLAVVPIFDQRLFHHHQSLLNILNSFGFSTKLLVKLLAIDQLHLCEINNSDDYWLLENSVAVFSRHNRRWLTRPAGLKVLSSHRRGLGLQFSCRQ